MVMGTKRIHCRVLLSFKDEFLLSDLMHWAINGTEPPRLSWQVRHRRGTKSYRLEAVHILQKKKKIVIAEGTASHSNHALGFIS